MCAIPFDSLEDAEYIIERLEQLANHPNLRERVVVDSILTQPLYALAERIRHVEIKHKIPENRPCYQRQLVCDLTYLIRLNDRADKLQAALPEVIELVYKALVISLEMDCGTFKPLADIARKVINGGKSGGKSKNGTSEENAAKRQKWQEAIDAKCNKHPAASFEAIKKYVANDSANNVSTHQLKRYIKDPRKNS